MGVKGKSWDDVEVPNSQSAWYDVFDQFKFPDVDWVTMRLVGDVYELDVHWVPTTKKGGEGETSFSVTCSKNISEDAPCPDCYAGIKRQKVFLCNAIIRDIQENKPEKKSKTVPPEGAEYRKKGDKWWSPIRVIKLPSGAASKIKSLKALNKHEIDGKIREMSIADVKYGCDIHISFDKSQSGSGMYNIQKGDHTPLSKEEKNFLLYNIEEVYNTTVPVKEMISGIRRAFDADLLDEDNCDLNEVKKILRGKVSFTDEGVKESDSEEDEDEPKSKKKSNKSDKKKSKKKVEDDDDDDSDDDIDVDNDEEEDEPPKKSKKKDKTSKKKKEKSKKKVEEDDDDSDDDDEEEEEDESPKKKKSNPPPKSKKKSKTEDDDDDDSDDEDEEEKKSKKKEKDKKSKKKSKSVDEDDEEEEEKSKKKKKQDKKSKKKSKSVDEDDEEEEDDEDEDDDIPDDDEDIDMEDDEEDSDDEDEEDEEEDEDEEPPKKSKGKNPKCFSNYSGKKSCKECAFLSKCIKKTDSE